MSSQQDLSGSKPTVFQCPHCALKCGKNEEILEHIRLKHTPKPCLRCGRKGHYSSTCQSKTDVNGNEIESEDEGYTSDKYYY